MEKKTYITQCSRCGRSYGSKVTTNGAAPSRTPSSMSGKCPSSSDGKLVLCQDLVQVKMRFSSS